MDLVRGAITKRAVLLLAIAAAFSLAALAILQYRWIAELGTSERALLKASLERGVRNFREEINTELLNLTDRTVRGPERSIEAAGERFASAAASIEHPRMIRVLYLAGDGDRLLRATPGGGAPVVSIKWPVYLDRLHEQLLDPGDGPPPRPFWNEDPPAIVLPMAPDGRPPPEDDEDRRPPPPRGWVVFEFDADYLRNQLWPALITKHFGSGFDLEVVSTADPSRPLLGQAIDHADVETGFFELKIDRPREGRRPPPREGAGPPQAPLFETARYQLRVRHPATGGSLDVEGARFRNLAVTLAVLLMMASSIAALVISLRRAEELNRMQLDFVAGVSHELRTPLSVIRTAGENLADGVVAGDKTRSYGALVRDEGRRLSNMVEQILRFAGVESGRSPYTFTPVAPAELIDRAIADAAGVLEKTEVEKQIAEGLPDVMADAPVFSHCLQNLIGNAVKHGGGGWIGIEATRSGAFVEFSVTDRGPGFDASDRRYLFDPFFRGKRATRDQVRGLGIGLSLVKRVAEAHGGRVDARNMPQGGARFSIYIPVATEGRA
ncbi:MAG TPA: HAMP domain-containing sensor histidine kinase [Bryobacteraceae bacterium]|jgi:signal transduction histidine kinase